MYVQERDGKYRFFERYTDPLTYKTKTVSITMDKNTTHSRNMAKHILRQMVNEKLDTPNSRKAVRLCDLADAYLAYQKDTVKANTYRYDRIGVESMLDILGPDTVYSALSPLFITNAMRKSDKSKNTLNVYFALFRAMCHWAVSCSLIDSSDAVDKVRMFKVRKDRQKVEEKYLEKEELAQLIGSMRLEHWKLLTTFLALSGLRIGEAIALEKSDIDYASHEIHVNKTYDHLNMVLTSTKTESSCRDIYMQPELEDVCRQIDRLMHRQVIQSRLFMHTKKGGYLSYTAYYKILRDAGNLIGKAVTPHVLRHTHASLLFEQGFTFDEIARRLGHADSKVTKEIYVHFTEKLREKDAKKLEGVRLID